MTQAAVEQFGVHLLLDAYDAPAESLSDAARLTEFLQKLPNQLGMHAISEPLVKVVGPNNRKDPGGISGFIMIAESHISFHTFPKRGFITIDVYTCQDELDTETLITKFQEQFAFTNYEHHVIKRGTHYPTINIH